MTNEPSSAPPPVPGRAAVLDAIDGVIDPRSGKGLVAAGLVQGLALGPGRAGFIMEVAAGDARLYAPVRDAAEAALRRVEGVAQAQVVLTAEGGGLQPYQPPAGTVRVRKGAQLSNEARAQTAPPVRPSGALKPDHVGLVIAVASGKGGVGKSTVAVNLACAFARLGYRTGLMDADVYGPSAPQMLGIDEEPQTGGDKKLKPLEAWGIKVMSIGFLVDAAAPMIWRGPMASSAVNQFLNDVSWGSATEPLDILVVDMPPGTGDIQLTLVQRVALAGAVLVSTPQEVALIDVRRGAAMFEKTATPILGIVENMAYFSDPSTGAPIPIFGRGGAQKTAQQLGVPFLGEIPIDMALREACDEGRPIVVATPDGPSARAFMAIAGELATRLESETARPAPRIVFED
ncbi:MAG TPA: P-loop NTPase [Caulobacteraceae bacterium]|nr:P-loop NTPase [Caulobacteraceae bacterium]